MRLSYSSLREAKWIGLLFPLIFFLLGITFLPYPGLEDDEVLFTMPYFHQPGSATYSMTIAHRKIPLMLLSYLGTLKTAIYVPILALFDSSIWTIRLPVLLLGCFTSWLIFRLLQKMHSFCAACIGAVLWVTHVSIILTTVYDWGPVVLQHLLLVAGLLLILNWWKTPKWWLLFLAFFDLGLAMWDKALFAWALGGITIAAVIIFPREILRSLNWRNLGLAACGFCIGALPLIKYNAHVDDNAHTRLATFHSNASFVFNQTELSDKFLILRRTFDGSVLLGYMVAEPFLDHEREPRGVTEHASFALESVTGPHRRSYGTAAAFCLSVLLIPFLWRTRARKALLFLWIALLVAWLQMAITSGAGASAHHAILIAPLVFLFIAVALSEASCSWWRKAMPCEPNRAAFWIITVFVSAVAISNLIVLNQNLYQFARYGAMGVWADAGSGLADYMEREHPAEIVVDDWGVLNNLTVLRNGKLPPEITVSEEFLAPGLNADQRRYYIRLLDECVWLGHTPDYRIFKAVDDQVMKGAEAAGYQKEIIRTIPDSHGRPVFEVFRFVKREAS